MNEEKKNDLLLNVLVNPTLSMGDLQTVGITADNSTVKDYDEYKSNELVQQAFKTESGNFNEKEFKGFYDNVLSMYNVMATQEQEQDFSNFVSFHRDNFFAPDKQRRDDFDSEFVKASNPYQITSSIAELGKPGKRTKSIDEIAQAEKVLANPVEVENGAAPIYHDSPNDSFFTDFFDTRVLAQWDEDGTHKDPISGETIEHKKGDLKLNDNGTFYYENLDGRSIYGRRVLSKLNTLTVDGSDWNKYDFFDSDNLEENGVGKTLLKNAALVGTMFIPYVGPAVAGLSVATQAVGLFGTLGKILVGSDSPTLSAMEGWSKSLNRQMAKSEYAQENTWCLENWINLIGDVAAQLKEQRFLFEKAPALFKGIGGASESRQMKKAAEIEKAYKTAAERRFQDLTKSRTFIDQFSADKARNELLAVAAVNAERDMNTFLKGYQKVGEVLSKAYMNGITTLDTYGEAKEAGATDLEAAMVAIGYAAQEAAILNTGIGEWILPELRADKFKNKALVKAINQDMKDTGGDLVERSIKKLPNEGKKQYIYRLFNIGKKIAKAEYANGTPGLMTKATLAGGLGEGIEEVIEELSADFTKSCYNTVKWLQGDDEHKMGAWENAKDRYLMSFFGGMVGGSFTNAFTSYQGMRYMKSLDYDTAIQELVTICRDPKQVSEFKKSIDKMDFNDLQIGNKRLTFETATDEDGNIIYKPGDKKHNQTIDIKNAVKKQVDLIVDTLNAEGAAIDDDSFLDQSALKDLRFYALRKATTAGMYLQQFNTACTDLVKASKLLNDFQHSHEPETDAKKAAERKKETTIVEENQLKKLTEDYEKAQKKVQDFVSGKHAAKYIQDALFEMNTSLSGQLTTVILPLYAEKLYGKKYNELTESEISDAVAKFNEWKNGEGKQKIHDVATQFVDVLRGTSDILSTQADAYKAQADNATVGGLTQLIHELYMMSNMPTELGEDIWIENAQNAIGSQQNYLKEFLTEQEGSGYEIGLLNTLSDEIVNIKQQIAELDDSDPNIPALQEKLEQKQKDYQNKQKNIFYDNFDSIIEKFTSQEFLHPEVKSALQTFLKNLHNEVSDQLEELQDNIGAYLSEEEEQEKKNILETLRDKITDAQTAIREKANSPISESLKQFSIALTGQYTDVLQLINAAYTAMDNAKHNLRDVQFDPTMREAFDNALELLKMYRAAISGSRVDNADILNIYGYSKALNDINHAQGTEDWTDLAEIDKDIADVFLNDVDVLIAKVEFAKTLMDINEGQKLQEQDKVSMNLHRLNFKGVKTFVQILDDDDDDIKNNVHFKELKDILENKSNLLQGLLDSGISSVPSQEEQINITKQSLQIEDKLYDLFNSLTEDELARIIKPRKLNLYEDKTYSLTKNLNEVDPIAFVTYLMRCAAVKSSKLHKMYLNTRKSINSKYAPITTQEANILNQIAFVFNGDMYTKFESAVKKAIMREWASFSEADKRVIKKNFNGEYANLLKPENDKYIMNVFGFFRYKNFVFNEGGPGTGKTTACDAMVVNMIKKYRPDLLEGAIVCHGADRYNDADSVKSTEKSQKLAEDCGVDLANVMNKKQLMKYAAPDYEIYSVNEDGTINVKSEDIELDDENEFRAKFNVSTKSDAPKIIIIDEISQFNSCELDLLQKFAERHGIAVIISGDINQSQSYGAFDVELNGVMYKWESEIERQNFCHSYKMGLSMRTRNNLKNINEKQLLTLQENKSGGDVKLKYYYSDNEGLIGDFIQTINPSADHKFIDSMFAKLADGEKVGYIYNDTNSDMYKYLTTHYADKIEMYPGTSALGSEGKYYIVDFNIDNVGSGKSKSTKAFLKDLYTAQTRSEIATILNFTNSIGNTVYPNIQSIDGSGRINLSCEQESSYQLEKLSEKAIENYAIKKEVILTAALANASDDVEYKERTVVAASTTPGSTPGSGPTPGSSPSPAPGGSPTPGTGSTTSVPGSGPSTAPGSGPGPSGGTGGSPAPRTTWNAAEMAIERSLRLGEMQAKGYTPGIKFYMETLPGTIEEYTFVDVVVKATKQVDIKYSDATTERTMDYDEFNDRITRGLIKLTPPPVIASAFDVFKASITQGLSYSTTDKKITILNFDEDANTIQYIDENGDIKTASFEQLFDILNNNGYINSGIDSFVLNIDGAISAFESDPKIKIEYDGEELELMPIPWVASDGSRKYIAKINDDGTLGIRFGIDPHGANRNSEICAILRPNGKWDLLIGDSPFIVDSYVKSSQELTSLTQALKTKFGNLHIYNIIKPDVFSEVIDMSIDENKTAGNKYGDVIEYDNRILDFLQDAFNEFVLQKRIQPESFDDVNWDEFDDSFGEEPPTGNSGTGSKEEKHFVDFDNPDGLKGLIFSFNTFETGAIWDGNGEIVTTGERKSDYDHNSHRIDSINGIAKLAAHWCGYDNFAINKDVFDTFRGLFTREDAIRLIAQFRAALLSTVNNDTLKEQIKSACTNVFAFVKSKVQNQNIQIDSTRVDVKEDVFNAEIGNLFIDHAIKTRFVKYGPDGNTLEDQTNYNGQRYGIFNRNEAERLEFNQDMDIPPSPNQIVSFIGINSEDADGKNTSQLFLELPIMTLNNPFSLIQSQEFLDLFNDENTIQNNILKKIDGVLTSGDETHNKSINIQTVLKTQIETRESASNANTAKNKKKINTLKWLLQSFKFFDSTNHDIVFLPKNTNLASIGNPQSNTRSTERGSAALDPRLGFKAEDKMNATEVAKALSNPMCIKTDMLMLKSQIQNIEIQPGMPFVLYSFNPAYTKGDLIDKFKEQRGNPNSRKDVFYAYVYTPFYSVEEYCENLHGILTRSASGNFRIGNKFSSYKILRDAIVGSDGKVDNDRLAKLRKFLDGSDIAKYKSASRNWQLATSTVETASHGLAHTILNAIAHTINRGYNYTDIDNVTITRTVKQGLQNITTEHSLTALCNDLLHHIAYDNNSDTINITRLNAFKALLGDEYAVRSVAKFKQQGNEDRQDGFRLVDQDRDMYGFTTYSLQGRPCTVYGKLDTPAFNVNLTNLYNLFLETIDHAEQENRRNGYDDLYGYTNIDRRTGKPHPFFYTRSQSRGRSRSRALTDEEFKAEIAKHFFGGDESILDIVLDGNPDIFPPKNARRIKPNDIQNMQYTTFAYNIRKCIELNGTLNQQTIQYPVISYSLTNWNAIFNSIPQYQNINFGNIDFEFTDDIDTDFISNENVETLLGIEFKNSNGDKLTINFESDMATGKLRVNYSVEKHPESRSEGETSSGVQVQLGRNTSTVMREITYKKPLSRDMVPLVNAEMGNILDNLQNNVGIQYDDPNIKRTIENFIGNFTTLSSMFERNGNNVENLNIGSKNNDTDFVTQIKNGSMGNFNDMLNEIKNLVEKLKTNLEMQEEQNFCPIILSISQ